MRLLIVGSLEGHLTSASQIAIKRGAKVQTVSAIDDALEMLRGGKGAELCLMDVRLNVARMVDALASERISVPVVACGIEGTEADVAVAAIEAGAKEYIPLPPDPDMIAAVFEAVAEESSTIIHRDPAMVQVLKLAEQIAPSDASVLVTGESGTGKEVMARHIHGRSRRASGPFVALNCAAIPENLLESELFGHEKGAFSGAVARRIGKFEEASGGTLLLDEVSEMDPRLQAKLLRAIQEREIDRVGGTKPVAIDVRILATTNRNLQQAVKDGQFREDLYFRLNVVNLRLPALRERREDIPVLAQHFAAKYAKSNGVPEKPIGEEALARMRSYDWPGNVRELENTMHRAVLLAGPEEIGGDAVLLTEGDALNDSPAPIGGDAAGPENAEAAAGGTGAEAGADGAAGADGEAGALDDGTRAALVGRTVAEVERDLIIDTLDHCLGNRTHAANILGISIRTLRNKLKQYAEDGFSVPLPGETEQQRSP